MSWENDSLEIKILLANRAYRRDREIPNVDLIVGIDRDSLGLKSGAMICSTMLKVSCPDCGKEKIVRFWEFTRGIHIRHQGCVARWVNANCRDYDEPGWRKKVGAKHRGKVVSVESRRKQSKTNLRRSPETRERERQGVLRHWQEAKLYGLRERVFPFRRAENISRGLHD